MNTPGKRRGRRRGKAHAQNNHALVQKRIEARKAVDPVFHYPEELPVSAARGEIAQALKDHQVIVVAGETGSGKTTQLPKLCMELGYGINGMIGHTQPRRIAARSVATRIAEETGIELGEGVGYQVRFTAHTDDSTRVKVMTDGILLAELQHDKYLRAYDVIIIDEAHERSLNIDFLLGFLARLLPKRPDLKVIITSATIDPESFSQHFKDAPIVSVSGRTYPVEMRYRPLDGAGSDDDTDGPGSDGTYDTGTANQTDGILEAVDELSREEPGDILVFLSGEREIRDTADALNGHLRTKGARYSQWEIVPLFGRLSATEQQRVFAPHNSTRVVLATNVAETSLTVPGIKYVIDAGTARISRYSNRTKVQRLPIERISQASARQRAGRAGRTSPGICVRLYSEEDFSARPEYTDPEILRTHLASVVLQMLTLGLVQSDNDILSFPFLTPPDSAAVRSGAALLSELGAIRKDNGRLRLTKLGRALGALPIDPRMARIVMAGVEYGVAAEVVVIVAALSLQDPRERPTEMRAQADEKHSRFARPASDFMSYIALWNYVHEQSQKLSTSKLRKLCKDEFINFVRVREWMDLVTQLCTMLKTAGHPIEKPGGGLGAGDQDPAIHTALLTGLLSSIGAKTHNSHDYVGARGTRFRIFPGSGLFKTKPDLVVAAELVETSRLWARTVAKIDPDWVIKAAGPLIRHQYSEPHWSTKKGQAFVYDHTSLYGVALTSDTRVGYARINPAEARDMFIRHALIDGEWNEDHAFVRHNEKALRTAHQLADRMRDNRLRADDELLFEFYDQALPAQVTSAPSFNSWWKKARQANPVALNIDPDALVAGNTLEARETAAAAFPLEWKLRGLPQNVKPNAKLRYTYDPGADSDGVTIHLNEQQATYADPAQFTWQVPGLRLELITALIRALPKAKRKYFVPAPNVARELNQQLEPYEGTLEDAVAQALTARAGGGELTDLMPIDVHAHDFDTERIPPHLRMRVIVHQSRKKPSQLAEFLKARAESKSPTPAPQVAPATRAGEKQRGAGTTSAFTPVTGVTKWRWDGLPAKGALIDRGTHVDLEEVEDAGRARLLHDRGVARLIAHNCSEARAYVVGGLKQSDKLVLAAQPNDIVSDCVFSAVLGIVAEREPVRDRDAYSACERAVNDHILTALERTLAHAVETLTVAQAVTKLISASSSLEILTGLTDVKEHVESLIHRGWVAHVHPKFVHRYPAYMEAARIRTEKMGQQPARDRQFMDRVHTVQGAITQRAPAYTRETVGLLPLAWQDLVFDVEELRISLWAPQVQAAHPVSEQRILKALKQCAREHPA